jgi:hypothetical protein
VVEDKCLTPEVLLHIANEVVSQLDRAKESKWLSPEEHSLHDFLVEHVGSLQFVVEVQDDYAPSLAQDPWPPQPGVASVDQFSGVVV